jgi:hypothetical protein
MWAVKALWQCDARENPEKCSGLWGKGITCVTCAVLLLLPPLHEHFPHTDTSEIRHVNRPWLRPYKRWPQQHNRYTNTHFILLIHCLAHLPFDDCMYSPQQKNYTKELCPSCLRVRAGVYKYYPLLSLLLSLTHFHFVPPKATSRDAMLPPSPQKMTTEISCPSSPACGRSHVSESSIALINFTKAKYYESCTMCPAKPPHP